MVAMSKPVDQRLSLITLGVRDLATSRSFYEDTLGWNAVEENDGVAFYNVGSVILALLTAGRSRIGHLVVGWSLHGLGVQC